MKIIQNIFQCKTKDIYLKKNINKIKKVKLNK